MSQSDDNTCPTCGGKQVIYIDTDPKTNKVDLSRVSVLLSTLCRCPSGERPQHDGVLPGRNPYQVKLIFGLRPKIASVTIGHEEVSDDEVWLSPEQALSLLTWLLQNRERLEKIVQARAE